MNSFERFQDRLSEIKDERDEARGERDEMQHEHDEMRELLQELEAHLTLNLISTPTEYVTMHQLKKIRALLHRIPAIGARVPV